MNRGAGRIVPWAGLALALAAGLLWSTLSADPYPERRHEGGVSTAVPTAPGSNDPPGTVLPGMASPDGLASCPPPPTTATQYICVLPAPASPIP